GYFQLFRFADKLDLIMIFLGLCVVLIYSMTTTAYMAIFGKLAGLFAATSFIGRCLPQQNASVTVSNSSGCPWNAEPNILNYDRLQK
ncbi:unnamed protein product, partial [Rotaria sp. Silwood1]